MSKRFLVLMCSIFLIVPLFFVGCSGDDGSDGAQGIQGEPGADGEDGPAGAVTNTNESCMVCHTDGKLADFAVFHPAETNVDLAVSNLTVTNTGGFAVVSFNLKSGADNADLLTNSMVRLYVADLVPVGAAENPESSPYFQRWAYERIGTGTSYVPFANFDNTNSAIGNYVITMATPLDNAVNGADVQRLFMRVSSYPGANGTAGILDFNIPAAGATVSAASLPQYQKAYVTVQACQQCHGNPMQQAAHGGGYVDTRACVVCHSPLLDDPEAAVINASTFYHKIHAAIPIAEFANRIGGRGYGAVTFPQEVQNCVICHNAGGNDLTGTAALIDNWKDKPTKLVCSSCHTGFPSTSHEPGDFKAQDGIAHPGGDALDKDCSACHPAEGVGFGKSVTVAHAITPTDNNVAEFDVTLSLDPVKSFYVAGDNVTVTATLRKHSDNTAVASTLYTAAKDTAGVVGGGLTQANLAFYGPRAMPVPIFAPTTTGGTRPQTKNLFVGSTDTSVATDNTGFKYKVTIPKGQKSGTYGVRLRFADYGRVGAGNAKVESIGFALVQVGTATVEKKVAGDICVNCHGAPPVTFEGHNERHVVVWDTDHCNSCHDYSGNHAGNLSNRVHAVHSANTLGDMLNTLSMQTTDGGVNEPDRDWSGITYPQNIERCVTCHASGNTSYTEVVHEVSCLGCHGDNIWTGGTTNHMLQNGGKYPLPE